VFLPAGIFLYDLDAHVGFTVRKKRSVIIASRFSKNFLYNQIGHMSGFTLLIISHFDNAHGPSPP